MIHHLIRMVGTEYEGASTTFRPLRPAVSLRTASNMLAGSSHLSLDSQSCLQALRLLLAVRYRNDGLWIEDLMSLNLRLLRSDGLFQAFG